MVILDSHKSEEIRTLYIQNFVDIDSSYYIHGIQNKEWFSDGLCYTGYLWDCLINPKVISESQIL